MAGDMAGPVTERQAVGAFDQQCVVGLFQGDGDHYMVVLPD